MSMGSWFLISCLFLFSFSHLNVGVSNSIKIFYSYFFFLIGGFIFFFWGYTFFISFFLLNNALYSLIGGGSSYIWLAGLTSFICFCVLTTIRTNVVFNKSGFALIVIFLAGITLLSTYSLVYFFFSFEVLLLVSLYLLRITAKSDRVEEAALEMLVWALGSSFGLLLGFGWLLSYQCFFFYDLDYNYISNLPLFFIVIAFAIKVPMWPAFSWLVRAHVEASVEFSILLSGFIIKVGAWGIYQIFFWYNSVFLSLFIGALSVMGVGIASIRLLAQRDLKRMVAYMTIIETNWLVFCISCGSSGFIQLGLYLTAVHGFTTALGFIFVEILSRRFQSRDWTQISGLYLLSPLIWLISFLLLLLLVGFPGTPLFFAKIIFLTLLWPYSPVLVFYFSLIFLIIIPLFLFRVWGSMWIGQPIFNKVRSLDLYSQEIILCFILIFGVFSLGFFPVCSLNFN